MKNIQMLYAARKIFTDSFTEKEMLCILLCQLRHRCYGLLWSIQRGKLFPLQLCGATGKKPLQKSIRARAARAFRGRDAFRAAIFRGSLVTVRNRCSRTSRIFRRLLCSSLTLHPERQCSQQPVAASIRTLHSCSQEACPSTRALIRLDKEGFNGSQITSLSLPLFLLSSIPQTYRPVLVTVKIGRSNFRKLQYTCVFNDDSYEYIIIE